MSASVVVQGRLQRGAPPVEIAIVGGRIDAIRPAGSGGASAVGGADCLVTEGFLDIQVNGFAAVDFNRPDLTVEDLVRATRAMWRTGVTQFLPTVVTAPVKSMLETLRAIARAREQEPILRRAIPGIHLEGPFLAPEDGPRGAHPADSIRDPDWGLFRQFQDAAAGLIRLVTIAPERPGAIGVIWQLRQAGIAVGIGHSDAKEADIDQAVEAGAQISCHLGNGAHAMLPRHRNYIQKQLADGRSDGLPDRRRTPLALLRREEHDPVQGRGSRHPHHGRHGRRRRAAREVPAGRGAGRGRFGRLRSPPRHSLSRRFGAHHGSGHRERGQIRWSLAGGCAATGQPATADALPRPGRGHGRRWSGPNLVVLARGAAAHRRGDDRRRGGGVSSEAERPSRAEHRLMGAGFPLSLSDTAVEERRRHGSHRAVPRGHHGHAPEDRGHPEGGHPDGGAAVCRRHRRGPLPVRDRDRRPLVHRQRGDVLAGRRPGADLPDPGPGAVPVPGGLAFEPDRADARVCDPDPQVPRRRETGMS